MMPCDCGVNESCLLMQLDMKCMCVCGEGGGADIMQKCSPTKKSTRI